MSVVEVVKEAGPFVVAPGYGANRDDNDDRPASVGATTNRVVSTSPAWLITRTDT